MAYGARLESVLGASPRGFESPILRHRTPGPVEVPGFLLPVAPLVFRAPSGPAAVCAGGRRPAREPSALRASLGASSRSPAGPSGPSGTAAGPSGALHTGGTCVAWASPARPRHRPRAPQPGPPAPSTPAALVVLCAPAANWAVTALLSPGLVPLDAEAFDDLCTRERGQDLARYEQLRSAQARADAAPSDRARRVDEEPP